MSRVRNILKKLMNIIPLKDKVVLESNPDLSDNTYSLFNKMIERGYNNKYRFYWLVQKPEEFSTIDIKNVYIREWNPSSFINKLKKLWLLYTSKYIIVCNKYIEKRRDEQVVVALGHGTILKSVKQYKMIGADCDFTLCPSEYFIPIYCDQLKLQEHQMLVSGYPRNDLIFSSKEKINKVLNLKQGSKVIIWMPTFRKQKNSGRVDSDFDFKLGIPIIYDEEALKEVNDYLVQNNTVLMLKLHPAQDTSIIKASSLSNLIILTDEMLGKSGVKLYEILSDTDALITDYSSIYYDYLLLDKPIGVTLDDFEEYTKKNGFPFENVLDILKGEYIYNKDDLIKFIKNVNQGIDEKRADRQVINNLVNKYQKGNYSEFVLNYLIENKKF